MSSRDVRHATGSRGGWTHDQHDGGVGGVVVGRRDLASRDALTISRASTIATGYSLRCPDGNAGCSVGRKWWFGGGLETGLIIFESQPQPAGVTSPKGKFGPSVAGQLLVGVQPIAACASVLTQPSLSSWDARRTVHAAIEKLACTGKNGLEWLAKWDATNEY
jgi:hypothetical protein